MFKYQQYVDVLPRLCSCFNITSILGVVWRSAVHWYHRLPCLCGCFNITSILGVVWRSEVHWYHRLPCLCGCFNITSILGVVWRSAVHWYHRLPCLCSCFNITSMLTGEPTFVVVSISPVYWGWFEDQQSIDITGSPAFVVVSISPVCWQVSLPLWLFRYHQYIARRTCLCSCFNITSILV